MAPTRYQTKRDIQKEGETKTSIMNIKENSFFKLREHIAVQRYSENPVEREERQRMKEVSSPFHKTEGGPERKWD